MVLLNFKEGKVSWDYPKHSEEEDLNSCINANGQVLLGSGSHITQYLTALHCPIWYPIGHL